MNLQRQEAARQLRQRQDVCGVLPKLPCQDGDQAVSEEGNGEGSTQPRIISQHLTASPIQTPANVYCENL